MKQERENKESNIAFQHFMMKTKIMKRGRNCFRSQSEFMKKYNTADNENSRDNCIYDTYYINLAKKTCSRVVDSPLSYLSPRFTGKPTEVVCL